MNSGLTESLVEFKIASNFELAESSDVREKLDQLGELKKISTT